jgi:hypothetical protein
MSEHIEAKPTEYRGVQFKSRLEARWAVFFDYYHMVNEWAYEPTTLSMPEKGWNYTPDFKIDYIGHHLLFEVKPVEVTEEHHYLLDCFGARLASTPLLLGTGDFYNSDIKVENITLGLKPELLLKAFPSCEESADIASKYRFDIPYIPPAFRRGSGAKFREVVARQQAILRQEERKKRKK